MRSSSIRCEAVSAPAIEGPFLHLHLRAICIDPLNDALPASQCECLARSSGRTDDEAGAENKNVWFEDPDALPCLHLLVNLPSLVVFCW